MKIVYILDALSGKNISNVIEILCIYIYEPNNDTCRKVIVKNEKLINLSNEVELGRPIYVSLKSAMKEKKIYSIILSKDNNLSGR